jgi:hypothetical protein
VFGTRKHPQAVAEDNTLFQAIQKIVELRLSDYEIEIAAQNSKQKFHLNSFHHPKHYARVSLPPSTHRKRDDAGGQARKSADRNGAGAALAGIFDPRFREFQFLFDVAAAIVTGVAARAHEALETAYDDFLTVPGPQRAVLLKALLVHCARWTPAHDLIVEILGPADKKHHVRQKDNVRRYLGYGAVDVGMVLDCATDRPTLWAVGRLQKEQSHTFSVPLPAVMSGKPQLHELSATVAWFAPPRVGAANYRGVRLKLVEPTQPAATFAVKAAGEQPDTNQAHRGTVIHRRWAGEKAAALGANASFELMIQRQPDEIDDPMPYAVVTTVTMPGVAEVYTQVRERVAVKPKVPVLP